MLAATLTTIVVFFPVTFLYGVSRFLFTALALSVVFSLLASYVVAMTVVPLFCAKFIKAHQAHEELGDDPNLRGKPRGWGQRFNNWFNRKFTGMLDGYEGVLKIGLLRPVALVLSISGVFILSLGLYPFIGQAPIFPAPIPASLSSASRHLRGLASN